MAVESGDVERDSRLTVVSLSLEEEEGRGCSSVLPSFNVFLGV